MMSEAFKANLDHVTTALAFATFVIGTLGIAGHIPNQAFGWITVGLGATVIALRVAHWSLDPTSWEKLVLCIIYGLTLITIGILGGLNVLTHHQVGWILVPPSLTKFIILACCAAGYCAACTK